MWSGIGEMWEIQHFGRYASRASNDRMLILLHLLPENMMSLL